MKKILVSVSNDLYNDNRVLKTCESLFSLGYDVTVVCKSPRLQRKNQYSNFEIKYPFLRVIRLKFWIKKNFGYYVELNLRLFFVLLFRQTNIFWANDLDTLLANYMVSKIKRKPIIFDSHEMFCFVAELKPGSVQQRFWLAIEKMIVPKLKYVVTVCEPIKEYFKNRYSVNAVIIRNVPPYKKSNQQPKQIQITEKYIIWQGSTNIDRGLEELILAMREVNARLLICGDGDIFEKLHIMVQENGLQEKIQLMGKISFEDMMLYTQGATLGICIDKPTNKNYAISLPNKIFEYINAATPVLYSPLSEIKQIEEKFHCGIELRSYDPNELALQINQIVSDNSLLNELSNNCLLAQKELNWQREEKVLCGLLDRVIM